MQKEEIGSTYHTNITVGMLLRQATKHPVPVWSTVMSRSSQRGDGILLGTDFLNDDVVHIIFLDLGREVDIDLYPILCVLFFDGTKERVEPLRGAVFANDPCEVDLLCRQ